jgi:hypothetical protein
MKLYTVSISYQLANGDIGTIILTGIPSATNMEMIKNLIHDKVGEVCSFEIFSVECDNEVEVH